MRGAARRMMVGQNLVRGWLDGLDCCLGGNIVGCRTACACFRKEHCGIHALGFS